MNGNWTKILATIFGALILALQGTNVIQGVALQGQETLIERVEDDLANKISDSYEIGMKRQIQMIKTLDDIKQQIADLKANH
jgi:hypothetical protein